MPFYHYRKARMMRTRRSMATLKGKGIASAYAIQYSAYNIIYLYFKTPFSH